MASSCRPSRAAGVVAAIAFVVSGCGGGSHSAPSVPSAPTTTQATWSVAQRGDIVEIAYGRGSDYPQYAALHTDSGYLRLNYGPTSGWGTSLILPPSFWSGGTYYQGAPLAASWTVDGTNLVVSFTGSISGLQFTGQIRLSPPTSSSISGVVTVEVSGSVALDSRPGEAFKPVMLSSMRVSADQWDAQSASVESQLVPIPTAGWILQPPVRGQRFALTGGTSAWKANAPTIEIALDESRDVTGWVTASANPNADNVGFWAATDVLVRSWHYDVTARP